MARWKSKIVTLTALLAICGAAIPAWANFTSGLVSVSLGGKHGAEFKGKAVMGEDNDKWNMLEGGQASKTTLVNTKEDLTDVTVTYTSDGPFDAGDAGFADTKFEPLMRHYLHSRLPSAVKIAGLTPNAEYVLVVYSASNTNGRRTAFTVGKETRTTNYKSDVKDLTEGVNYTHFNCTADASGVVTIYYQTAGRGDEGNINGFQISPKGK